MSCRISCKPGPKASKASRNGDSERPSIPEKNLAWLSNEHIETSQQKRLYISLFRCNPKGGCCWDEDKDGKSLESLEGGVA